MTRIGILSDTHGFLPTQAFSFFSDCDELWHAGDIGPGVLDPLRSFKPTRAVWGNCDDLSLHHQLQERLFFQIEGQRILLTHIGGYPGHYPYELRRTLQLAQPDIFVCGHSHILKVVYDHDMHFLHINPGAAGRQGIHRVATLLRFVLDPQPRNMEILELPKQQQTSPL